VSSGLVFVASNYVLNKIFSSMFGRKYYGMNKNIDKFAVTVIHISMMSYLSTIEIFTIMLIGIRYVGHHRI
jgi:hypothetical protein